MRTRLILVFLTFTFGISNSVFAKVETDTITTWKLSKDLEVLIESNHFSSTIYSVELNINDEYKNLNVSVFYDFLPGNVHRKITFMVEKKIIAEFEEEKNSQLPFKLPKEEIDKVILGVLNKPIAIIYSDSISENGILVGFVTFKKE